MGFYNWFLAKALLPIGNLLTAGDYLKNIDSWSAYDKLSEEKLKTIQEQNLVKILSYAIEYVPAYKHFSYKTLSDFPILTKDILRDRVLDIISHEYNISKLDKHHSSGSSGIQSFTYMTKEHTFYLRSIQTHWWKWSGYRIGDHLIQFGISQKRSILKKLKDIFYRCYYVKAFGLSEKELINILEVNKNKNCYIAGYPSVLNQLAKASILSKKSPNVKGVICFGDKLFDHYATTIKTAFGSKTKIIDTYGCAEGMLIACKFDLDYYYIMSPHVYIEIVDDEGNLLEDGQMGNVLVTCLTNYAMPLIRYKLGDLAIKLPKVEYPKERRYQYPLLKKVVGRETDIVKTTQGITLNIHSFTGVIEYFQEIKQYKIIQNNLEKIIIEYIVDTKYSFDTSILDSIKKKLNDLTKHSLEIVFIEVEVILPTKSGKPQIIESNLKL